MSRDFGYSLIPDEELKNQKNLNLAPMVDFLFLIIALFAVLAVTRTVLYDSEVKLVKMDSQTTPPSLAEGQNAYTVLLSIDDRGQYKWVTEFNEFLLEGVSAITQELHKQQELGLLPEDKSHIKVLLQIDKNAQWDPIAKAIFTLKESGYSISPVYTPDD